MIALGVVCLVIAAIASIFVVDWRHPAIKALVIVGAILVAVGVILTLGHHRTY